MCMKKGINAWSFPQTYCTQEIINSANTAQFDGVELNLSESGEISVASSEADILKIKAYAAEKKICLYSLSTALYWTYSLTDNDQAIRTKAQDIIKKQLETAKLLGCDTILVVPGLVTKEVSYDAAYERAYEGIRSALPVAEELQVKIGLENVWNNFLLSPLEMRGFIDSFQSPYVGMYLDIGNILYTGFPEQWIRILADRILKIHIKDYQMQSRAWVDLLCGDVDFPAAIKALEETGYTGWITAEMQNYRHYPEQLIENTSNSMDKILKRK